MQQIAAVLNVDERQRVAAWYATQPLPQSASSAGGHSEVAERLWLRGDPARGLPACAQCHGRTGEGLGAGNPPLHHQPAPYIVEQLEAWRTGRRQNSPMRVMAEISRELEESEINALARYAAQLPGVSPADEEKAR